ncbi:unnamed protein product, partial [Urochloa humidicola]
TVETEEVRDTVAQEAHPEVVIDSSVAQPREEPETGASAGATAALVFGEPQLPDKKSKRKSAPLPPRKKARVAVETTASQPTTQRPEGLADIPEESVPAASQPTPSA